MKISEAWLREWVNPVVDVKKLTEQLIFAGLEVESLNSCPAEFTHVVVGRVVEVKPHPGTDKLKVCIVDSGKEKLQIVCGAPNVRAGMHAPLALIGAVLPNNLRVNQMALRGVESRGMLCSGRELGLSDESTGLMPLPADACVGKPLAAYLGLPDRVLELKLTPNRGDCLSVAGIAREVACINRIELKSPRIRAVKASCKDKLPIALKAPEGCPLYAGRIIKSLRTDAISPVWLTERLRRAGLRSIHPVVDVTNYVMLELGQPMHGFDLRQLRGGIVVRWARKGETLMLLDGRQIELSKDVLVIADHKKVKALAGVMGGDESGVAADTADIFLESAFFAPEAIAGRARRFGFSTDASHRFERGVDPALPRRALERATTLLLDIAGGQAGPVVEARIAAKLPRNRPVRLRRERLTKRLGLSVPDREVVSILERLDMGIKPLAKANAWQITPPSFRFDIHHEEDLIEEVGRIHGFERIPTIPLITAIRPGQASERRVALAQQREALVQRGYTEVVTYSFVAQSLDTWLAGHGDGVELENPISTEMTELRRSLWTGLIQTLSYNLNRQQERIRVFECGRKYTRQDLDIKEENYLAGLAYGRVEPEQWGITAQPVAFADVKADIEALLTLSGRTAQFIRASHPALHPGRTAAIRSGNHHWGWLGELHPELVKRLDLPAPAILFELAREATSERPVPSFKPISRFPSVRRDIAVVVDEEISAEALQACISASASRLLQQAFIFDIYRGKGIDSGRKSVALGLILQDSSRTLTDEAADTIMSQLIERLRRELGATIRE
ncbi:MAG: phenylalanine--tRNA ligase subunit beta [Gammaproteobacteria bacterium]